jgi:hypothetical protein
LLTTRCRITFTLLIAVGILLLAGCPPRVSIAKINRDPGRYAGEEITIAGRVIDSYGALGRGAFEIDDGTGTMWSSPDNTGFRGREPKWP